MGGRCDAFPFSIVLANGSLKTMMTTNEGLSLNIEDCAAIWLRRPKADQIDIGERNKTESEFISNECKGAK
jgi:hypothetical protein